MFGKKIRFSVLMLVLLSLFHVLPARADKVIRLTFTGDVTLGSEEKKRGLSSSFDAVAAREGYDYFFRQVKPLFEQDDLTVVNLEGVLSDSSKNENTKKTYRFRGPVDFARILPEGSIEAANIANNHTMDYGKTGYADTGKALDGAHIGYFGNQTVYIFEKDGIRIAFFGLNSSAVARNRSWAIQEIGRLKREEGVHAVVFCFHGGTEYGRVRNARQEDYAQFAIKAGADLVVMHHPHVVQGLDIINNRSVFYSLGNFCFGGNREVRALEALVAGVEMHFSDAGTYLGQQVTLHAAHISGTTPESNFQPVLVQGEAVQAVNQRIAQDTKIAWTPIDPSTGMGVQEYLPAVPGGEAPQGQQGYLVKEGGT